MILVKDVTVLKVKGDVVNFAHIPEYDGPIEWDYSDSDPIEIRNEVIRGTVFCDRHGQKVCIGATEDVQRLIGLPFEVFNNQQNELTRANAESRRYRRELNAALVEIGRIGTADWWDRLKFLFTGRIGQ